jgi:hypothetical protein
MPLSPQHLDQLHCIARGLESPDWPSSASAPTPSTRPSRKRCSTSAPAFALASKTVPRLGGLEFRKQHRCRDSAPDLHQLCWDSSLGPRDFEENHVAHD